MIRHLFSDETFEYGTEGKLHCQVDAYPTANIKWYHNGTFLQSTEEENISADNHMILIKTIDQDDAGEYKCQIENGIEKKTFTAVVSVTGLGEVLIHLYLYYKLTSAPI